jgi:hypothetical protein
MPEHIIIHLAKVIKIFPTDLSRSRTMDGGHEVYEGYEKIILKWILVIQK